MEGETSTFVSLTHVWLLHMKRQNFRPAVVLWELVPLFFWLLPCSVRSATLLSMTSRTAGRPSVISILVSDSDPALSAQPSSYSSHQNVHLSSHLITVPHKSLFLYTVKINNLWSDSFAKNLLHISLKMWPVNHIVLHTMPETAFST